MSAERVIVHDGNCEIFEKSSVMPKKYGHVDSVLT